MKAVVGVRQGGTRSVGMLAHDALDEKMGVFDAAYRIQLLKEARAGKEEALAYIRDCLCVRTLVLNKRKLIDHGVLVGVRHG
jgi:hypothetical protein